MDNKQYFNTAVSTSESIVQPVVTRNVFEGLENQTPELLSVFPSIDYTYRRPGHRGYFHFGIGQTESQALQNRKLLTAGPVLSEAAKSALSAYQKSAAINDHLRGQELRGSSQNTPEVFESQSATRRFIRDLDQVTVSQKTKRQVIGYRGLRAEGEFREKFHPGQRWSEPGYSSVSTLRRISEQFMDQHLDVESGVNAERSAANSILMTVHFPKGYRASAHLVQSIPGHGTGQPEAEMLLRRGAPLRILSEEFFPGGTLRTPHTEVRAIALRFARGRLFHENALVRRSLSNSVEPERLYRAHVHRSIPIAPVIAAEASNPALLKEGLQQIHVNLESKVGQFFKTLWKLPFKKHSRLDPMAAAVQAKKFLSNTFFKGKALDFTRGVSDGVPVFRGFDPNSAFTGQRASGLAGAEVWAHGGPKASAEGWFLLNAEKKSELASDVVSRIIDQEKVSSVLLDACNKSQTLIRAPKGGSITYGLGYGVAEGQFIHRNVPSVNPIKAWTEGVVISEGDTAQIFTKSAIQAHLEGKGTPVQGLISKLTVKANEGLRETDVLGLFTNQQGKRTLTLSPNAGSVEELGRFSVPLEDAPSITARFKGNVPTFEIQGGRTFPTLEEASHALTTSIRGKNVMAQRASSLVQRAAGAVETKGIQEVGATLSREFKPSSYTGILLAGVLAIGGSFALKGWKTISQAVDNDQQQNQPHGYNIPPSHSSPLHGGQEHFSIRKTFAGSPEGSTKITVDDAELDHAAVDKAFSTHLRGGLAYGRRSS